ncbi:MAG: hypothetical protein MJZ85_04145 [Bacteroidales bacterium]|nr:hypothetical protein [Bacteroidales bacterium]
MNYWAFLLPTLFLVLLAFASIGIKMIVRKDGKFERRCAHSLDPDAKCVCGGGKCRNQVKKEEEKEEEKVIS